MGEEVQRANAQVVADFLLHIFPLLINLLTCNILKIVFYELMVIVTTQKMKFSVKDFFSECDQIRSFLWIWSHLLKKSLIENFIFCALSLLKLSR